MKKAMVSNCFSVISIVLMSSFSLAQVISKEATISDLHYLQEKIVTYQPGLDQFAPNFLKESEMIIESIEKDSISYLEYNQLVSKVCVVAKEGHFTIGTWSDTVRKGIPESTYKYLPLDIVILNNKVYLETDYSKEQSLVIGSEITKINDKPISLVLQEMFYCMPSDGAIMSNVLNELDYAFPYNYYFYVEQTDNFILELKKPNDERHIASIAALSKKEQTVNYRTYVQPDLPQNSIKLNPVYSLEKTNDFALLNLRNFNSAKLKKQEIKPRKFYKRIFDSLAIWEAQNLVIDLRDNTGGLFTMATELVPFLFENTPDDRIARESISWKGKKKKYKFRKKSKKAFQGNVYVLINGGTFSSASTLARYLKEETDAVLIGEESGSRYEAFAAGSKQYIYLPNSGIQVGIPRYLSQFGAPEKQTTKNRGVFPNYTVSYTIEDVMNKNDLHMNKVQEFVKDVQK